MDFVVEDNQLGMMKHGIGQPVTRSEDPKLWRGRLCRLPALDHERSCRCSRATRREAYRHAGNAGKGLGGYTRSKGRLNRRPRPGE